MKQYRIYREASYDRWEYLVQSKFLGLFWITDLCGRWSTVEQAKQYIVELKRDAIHRAERTKRGNGVEE